MRRNNDYAGLHESSEAPGKFSIDELLDELEKVKDIRLGIERLVSDPGQRDCSQA